MAVGTGVNVCGAAGSPYLEATAGLVTTFPLTALNPDGTLMNLTGAVVEVRVGRPAVVAQTPTYSTATSSVTVAAPLTGVFTVTTSATVDVNPGYGSYIVTITPAGGVAAILVHGPYGVARAGEADQPTFTLDGGTPVASSAGGITGGTP